MIKFINAVPWVGINSFFCAPGEIIDLPPDVADAREKAGLGTIVIDKSKKKLPEEPTK